MPSPREPSSEPPVDRHLAVLEASPNAIVAVRDDGRIAYANPQVGTTFGHRPGDLIGRPIEVLLPDAVAGRHVAHRTRFLAQPTARPMGIGMDLAARRADGSTFPVEISLSTVSEDGRQLVYATVVDITARQEAEEMARESQRRVQAVLEASPNAIVAVGPDGLISYANPRVEATFDHVPADLVGRPIEILLPERIAPRHVRHRDSYIAQPNARPMGIGLDLAGRRRDGSEFPVEISLAPVESADGLVVYATIVDITARKAGEARLLEAQKMESIGRLAGGIAHDFNNMLFAIRGHVELLTEDMAGPLEDIDPADVRDRVAAIGDAADRASKLTAQLLSFSRRQMISPTVIDVVASIQSIVPMLRSIIGEHVTLSLKLDAETGRILVDPGQFDQILVNLAVNARDAMSEGGTITITSGNAAFDAEDIVGRIDMTPGPYVAIAVSDTGVGMDAVTRARAFEPFFTTKDPGKGTGLGLATIYGIVRQSGGHAWLYSEPSLGTTCKLYFPRADGAVDTLAAFVPPAADRPGIALVVEDDDVVRDLTTELLRRAGFTVEAVSDGMAALDVFKAGARRFDVVVSDVVMPGMSGIVMAERLRDEDPSVGVVLLSGYTEDALAIDASSSERTIFVSKPITRRQLLEAVRQVRRT